MKILNTILLSLVLFSTCLRATSELTSVSQQLTKATSVGALVCTMLGAYKIAVGSLQCLTLRPLRGFRSLGWGGISLCAAYTLFTWSQSLRARQDFYWATPRN